MNTLTRRLPALLAATLPVLTGHPGFAQQTLSGEDIDRISRSVVRIVATRNGSEYATGSGTLVNATGQIYTNRHVVEGADDFIIELLDDPNELPVAAYRAGLKGYSMDVDFAVLQIDRNATGSEIDAAQLDLPFLAMLDDQPRRGDEIFVFGYPGLGDGYLTFTAGTVTTIRNGTMNAERMPVWLQTDAQISPGNSGGLAVNAAGDMIGIPTAVISEDRTGGRLGGILPVTAVSATIDSGLEADVSRIAEATNAPVIDGGSLDYSLQPTYGTAALAALFTPDPYTTEVVSGGEVAVGYLGGECTGYAAIAPDFRLNWSGSSAQLRVFFSADDGGDTTLVINRPDGSWVCNDDAEGTRDPMVVLDDPATGQYDIWVGSYSAGAYVGGTLSVTERAIDPRSGGPSELNFADNPFFGTLNLEAGFVPDPRTVSISAGGSVDVSYIGSGCVGYAAQAPDLRLQWGGTSNALRLFFEAADNGDTSLIINLPDGSWACNDDSNNTLDPMITIANPQSGQYDIWVGTYRAGDLLAGELTITERDLSP